MKKINLVFIRQATQPIINLFYETITMQRIHQGCIIRLVIISMRSKVRKMSSSKIDKEKINIASIVSDAILGFYLSILGDYIFRTWERIKSNQPYFTYNLDNFHQT